METDCAKAEPLMKTVIVNPPTRSPTYPRRALLSGVPVIVVGGFTTGSGDVVFEIEMKPSA